MSAVHRCALNRPAHRYAAHGHQAVEGRHQIIERRQAQEYRGVTLQGSQPVPRPVGNTSARPAAGGQALLQESAHGGGIGLVARKEALGPQPDDAAAFRTTISADAKRLIKAVENHLHEIMKPYPWMPAAGAIVGPRPGIIAAVFGNLVEIQQERRYHGITFCGGGSPASGFVDGGCWRTHRPVFFKIKKDPCSQGPLNPKFSACLSTDSENYPLPPNTLLWDATTGLFQPPARCPVLWPLLTPCPAAPAGSPQVRARCFSARPPHLPPRLDRAASLCCASSPYRVGLTMRFLSIGPPISHSLPPPGRLPFRSWLLVVVASCFHDRSSYRGLSPHLQRAHAGRTQCHALDFVPLSLHKTSDGKR